MYVPPPAPPVLLPWPHPLPLTRMSGCGTDGKNGGGGSITGLWLVAGAPACRAGQVKTVRPHTGSEGAATMWAATGIQQQADMRAHDSPSCPASWVAQHAAGPARPGPAAEQAKVGRQQ